MELHPESVRNLYPYLEFENGDKLGVKIRQAGSEEVRLDVTEPLDIGQSLALRIEDDRQHVWYRASAEIHWSQNGTYGWNIGQYLSQPLPEEIQAWPEWDRRQSLRYSVRIPARIWWQGARQSAPALVVNYSMHGAGIICREQVTLGRPAIITVGTAAEDPVCVAATACWQVQASDGILVGFETKAHDGKRFAIQAAHQPARSNLIPTRRARPAPC